MIKLKSFGFCYISIFLLTIQNGTTFELQGRPRGSGRGDARYEAFVDQILTQQGEMNTALASIKSIIHNQYLQDTEIKQEMEFIKSKIFELKNLISQTAAESKLEYESVHAHVKKWANAKPDESHQITANKLEHQFSRLESIILRGRFEDVLKDLKNASQNNDREVQSHIVSAEWIWKQALEHEELIKEFANLPEQICSKLNDLQEYNRSLAFISETSGKLETVLGSEHEQILKLKVCEANARKHTSMLTANRTNEESLLLDVDTAERMWKQSLKYDALIQELAYFPSENCSTRTDFKDHEKVLGFVQESSEKLQNVLEFQNVYSLRINLCKAGAKNDMNITATDKMAKSEFAATENLWRLALKHDKLVKDFGHLPLHLCSKLNGLHEYDRSLLLVEEAIPRFETVFGVDHENTLRLKFCKATNPNFNRGAELLKSMLAVAKKNLGNNHELTKEIQSQTELPKDCCGIQAAGNTKSGLYSIYPYEYPSREVEVYCDLSTNGGGWTVFQRREEVMGPSVNFYQDWASYESGFGNLSYSFWLGLPHISVLTQTQNQSLRVDMTGWENESKHANYKYFKVANSSELYRLTLSGYTGTAGDSMKQDTNHKFSTKDRDNDDWQRHCVEHKKGAWWHTNCSNVNPNGIYKVKEIHTKEEHDGVTWYDFKSTYFYSLKRIELKFRPQEFPNGCRKVAK